MLLEKLKCNNVSVKEKLNIIKEFSEDDASADAMYEETEEDYYYHYNNMYIENVVSLVTDSFSVNEITSNIELIKEILSIDDNKIERILNENVLTELLDIE